MSDSTERLQGLNIDCTRDRPRPRLKPRGLPSAVSSDEVIHARGTVEAESVGAALIGRHRVRPHAAGKAGLEASFHRVPIRDLALGYARYSASVSLESTALPADYFVIVPTGGTSRLTVGEETVELSPVCGATLGPGSPFRLDCAAESIHLVIRLARGPLRLHLGRLLGHAPKRELQLARRFDLSDPATNRWSLGVQLLHTEVLDAGSLLRKGIGVRQIEEFMMSSLLYTQDSNYRERLEGISNRQSAVIRSACRFIDAHLSEPISTADIAEAVGVSVRTLQGQFAAELSRSPTGFLRDRRLDEVRETLASATPASGVTVSETAERFGFNHLGRFSSAYRDRFGESPSTTLRR